MLQEVFNFLDSKKVSENKEHTAKINDLKNYFRDFFQLYPQKDFERISSLSDREIMTALIILSNPLKLEEILEILKKYPKIFKNDRYTELFAALTLYYDDKRVPDLVEDCISLNPFIYIPATLSLSKVFVENGIPPQIGDIIDFIKENPQAKEELEVVFTNYSAHFHNYGAYMIEAIRRFSAFQEFDEEQYFLSTLTREEKRQYKKMVGLDKSEQDLFLKEIRKFYNFLNTKLDEIVKSYEKSERDRRSHNRNIEDLKRILDTKEEIKNIDAIIKLCATEEIKEVVVNYILDHNRKIYSALITEYEKARVNSDENLNNLFNKYGFNYEILDSKDKAQLKKMNFEDIEELLKRLSLLKVYQINVARVSLFKLSVIEELVFKGIISEEWLINNESLLLEDNRELDIVITNIDMLSKEGINMIQYSNSLDITKSTTLKHNLYLLRLYNLAVNKNTTNINFLGVRDLRQRIEFIYSLGLYQELTDLNILNNSMEDLLRIKIANSLNISVDSITDISELYCDFSTEVIPEDIKEKLGKESDFILGIPAFLEEYRDSNQTLNINGIYVSSEKVKRNLAKIGSNDSESCFYAIIYNGFYTYEEIEILKGVLLPRGNQLS